MKRMGWIRKLCLGSCMNANERDNFDGLTIGAGAISTEALSSRATIAEATGGSAAAAAALGALAIGGLAVSTIFTLILVPAVYEAFYSRRGAEASR